MCPLCQQAPLRNSTYGGCRVEPAQSKILPTQPSSTRRQPQHHRHPTQPIQAQSHLPRLPETASRRERGASPSLPSPETFMNNALLLVDCRSIAAREQASLRRAAPSADDGLTALGSTNADAAHAPHAMAPSTLEIMEPTSACDTQTRNGYAFSGSCEDGAGRGAGSYGSIHNNAFSTYGKLTFNLKFRI